MFANLNVLSEMTDGSLEKMVQLSLSIIGNNLFIYVIAGTILGIAITWFIKAFYYMVKLKVMDFEKGLYHPMKEGTEKITFSFILTIAVTFFVIHTALYSVNQKLEPIKKTEQKIKVLELANVLIKGKDTYPFKSISLLTKKEKTEIKIILDEIRADGIIRQMEYDKLIYAFKKVGNKYDPYENAEKTFKNFLRESKKE